MDLRLGPYQTALADVAEVDAVICDPPYGQRTHDGQRTDDTEDGAKRRSIPYHMWTDADVAEFVDSWAPRCRGWIVALTSHDLVPSYRAALDRHGRYTFAPLPFVSPGSRVRLAGDGPSSWTCWLVVSRPATKAYQRWGTLPGAYVVPPERDMVVSGGKPRALMRALVRDYTRPGDLVCDPTAGGGTTLLAAHLEGRRAIGAEMDPQTYQLAAERLRGLGPARGPQRNLFGEAV